MIDEAHHAPAETYRRILHQSVIVSMPLRRFQQHRYIDYGRDVAWVQFNPSLRRQLLESDIERVRAICRASIERYYLRLA